MLPSTEETLLSRDSKLGEAKLPPKVEKVG